MAIKITFVKWTSSSKMIYLTVYLFLIYLRICFGLNNLQGWNYINLHCRDNSNAPVDWWYIYKPPSMIEDPFMSDGRNFSFITPNTERRWQPSHKRITSTGMLQHTLGPMFRPTYIDNMAFLVYNQSEPHGSFKGSTAQGIMMSDERGGLWIGHTIPGFPDVTRDRPRFPESEVANGHMIVCISLDLVTLNEMAVSIQKTSPKMTAIHIPNSLKRYLPDWQGLVKNLNKTTARKNSEPSSKFEFVSRDHTLRAVMLSRQPGGKQCLYTAFAKNKKIVLDVYSPSRTTVVSSVCSDTYSIRNIDGISLKFQESVHYIQTAPDRARFAVSTAAHWQRRGDSPGEYWTCTSNYAKEDRSGKGAVMICVENYHIWSCFDNFKIKEPDC